MSNEAQVPPNWWTRPIDELIKLFNTDPRKGLSEAQVLANRTRFGANEYEPIRAATITSLIMEGITQPMMLVLLAIAGISLLFGKRLEAITMIGVVLAYITVELINKFRTDRTMVHLRSLTHETVQVLRSDHAVEVPRADLVAGDILILSEGVLIAADARLVTSFGLLVNEASLTGESAPVNKSVDAQVSKDAPLAERTNAIRSGTVVLSGAGTALVCAVGAQSAVGKIAHQVQAAPEKTVLQNTMTQLAKVLTIFALGISFLVPLVGYLRGMQLQDMVLTWLSMTFLMVPGQPPIIITMALALAALAMAKKHILVKRLRGVEGMGQVNCLVSDKTGTITQNVMVLETFFRADTLQESTEIPPELRAVVGQALPPFSKDPTDQAAAKLLERNGERKQVGFSGFGENKPWRDVVYQEGAVYTHAISGSPEMLIEKSDLAPEQRSALSTYEQKKAAQGKRIAAYAWCKSEQSELKELPRLTLVGLAVISDQVRPGVKDALAVLAQAGIATVIVTGDYAATAQAIGREVGITGDVMTGEQLAAMSDDALVAQIKQHHATIFARVDPTQKVHLVTALERAGQVVATVGDGVNDVPAMHAAQVGIAMGKIGTDLAKDVSDLIITDDDYSHIPDAVLYGRVALHNFRKGLSYYLSAKTILLTLFVVPLALGLP